MPVRASAESIGLNGTGTTVAPTAAATGSCHSSCAGAWKYFCCSTIREHGGRKRRRAGTELKATQPHNLFQNYCHAALPLAFAVAGPRCARYFTKRSALGLRIGGREDDLGVDMCICVDMSAGLCAPICIGMCTRHVRRHVRRRMYKDMYGHVHRHAGKTTEEWCADRHVHKCIYVCL